MSTSVSDFPGARFYKTDLHVHSPASKGCWKGEPGEKGLRLLFEKLKHERIEVVAITDHNSVSNIEAAKALGLELGIRVFPGVEISTREGHVLAIFDPSKPTSSIDDWLTQLGLTQECRGIAEKQAKDTDGEALSITAVFGLIERAGGVAIAPHPNSQGTGFMEVMKQKGTARKEAYHSPYLRGLEVGEDKEKVLRFASGKVSPDYTKTYGCVANSDAHSPDEIGRVFSYIKLGDFGVGAIKQAFYDPAMRIRFADQWPLPQHSGIESLEVSQGFFSNTVFRFHPDMNCLVGGKAVGKSLLVEFIKFALGTTSPINSVNQESEAKLKAMTCLGEGGTVTLHVASKTGDRYRIERTLSDLDTGPQVYYAGTQTKAAHAIEEVFEAKVYSQNEIIELGKELPALLDWMDGFTDLSEDWDKIADLKTKIKSLLAKLDDAHALASRLPELRKRKKDLEEKKKLLEGKVKESILKDFPKWQKEEREIRSLQKGIGNLKNDILEKVETVDLDEYIPDPEKGTPNYADLLRHKLLLSELAKSLQELAGNLRKAIDEKQRAFQAFVLEWRKLFQSAEKKYDEIIKAAGVKSAPALVAELDRVIEAIEETDKGLKKSEAAAKTEAALQDTLRSTMMPDYNKHFAGIFKKRLNKAEQITKALCEYVRIQVRQMDNRKEFSEDLTSMAKGSGLRKAELDQVCNSITPLELAVLLVDKDSARLANLTGMKEDRAATLINHAWTQCLTEEEGERPSRIYEIMLTELKDSVLVELKVDGESYKPMQELSGGSKCTAILSVALIEGECPLIIDQPEDALDNPFIFKQIVSTVRRTKSNRQYILTTHNPNIAVASDADLIYCLKASASLGEIDRSGSIDEISTRDKIVANLEGGADAFHLRTQKYDIPVNDPNQVVAGPQFSA